MAVEILDTKQRQRLPVPAFSAHLAGLLESSGMTQTDFAREVGLNQPYVSALIRGKERVPTERSIRRMAEVLGVDADDLLWRAEIVPGALYDAGLFAIPYAKVRAFAKRSNR
jgi:transcriptional regulator with XRE-family HTH domain